MNVRDNEGIEDGDWRCRLADAFAWYVTKMDIPYEVTISFLVEHDDSSTLQRGQHADELSRAAALQGEAHRL